MFCLLALPGLLATVAFAEPALWPQPSSVVLEGPTLSLLVDSFEFVAANGSDSPLLERAFARYNALSFIPAIPAWWPPQPAPTATLSRIVVNLLSQSQDLSLNTSEAYTLILPASGGNGMLNADTVFGALRGEIGVTKTLLLQPTVDTCPIFRPRNVFPDDWLCWRSFHCKRCYD